MLGVRFEDFGALGGASTGGMGVGAQTARGSTGAGTASVRCGDRSFAGTLVAESVHAEDATVVATFEDGLDAGSPALTRHRSGLGEAWYVATMPDPAGLDAVVAAVVAASGVRPVVDDLPPGVEAARRGDLVTVINHGDEPVEITIEGTDAESGAALGRRVLEPQDVLFALSPVALAQGRIAVPSALAGR